MFVPRARRMELVIRAQNSPEGTCYSWPELAGGNLLFVDRTRQTELVIPELAGKQSIFMQNWHSALSSWHWLYCLKDFTLSGQLRNKLVLGKFGVVSKQFTNIYVMENKITLRH